MQNQDASLQSSVNVLDSTVQFLHDTNQYMDSATKDFERLKIVLETNKVFGMVSLSDVEQAKSEVAGDIHPQISSILDRIENEVAKLERKQRSLTSKAELQQVRLAQFGKENSDDAPKPTTEQLELLREMQQKRDRLQYSLKTLNLQKQKARMSLAWPQR